MFDAELDVKALADFMEKFVAGWSVRHFQMNGERDSGRAQWPDVQIVHRAHTLERFQIITDRDWIDIWRHQIERHGKGMTQQSPRSPNNHGVDRETGDW